MRTNRDSFQSGNKLLQCGKRLQQLKVEWIITSLFVDCLPSTIDVAAGKVSYFAIKNQHKICQKQFIESKKQKISHDHAVQNKINKTNKINTSVDIFKVRRKIKMKQTAKHDWTRFVLKLCLVKFKIYSSTFHTTVTFLCLLFTEKSVVQTAWLLDLLAMQHLETAV